MAVALHLIIHGRVQGVGYRSWTCKRARAHGLTGWVRNRSDNTVEAVLCGDEPALNLMRAECSQGPLAARVDRMDEQAWQGDVPADFQQVPTV